LNRDLIMLEVAETASAHYDRGNAMFDAGEFAAAVDSYGKALEIEPRHALSRGNRGLALFCLKLFDAALADFDAAIAIEPNNPEPHYHRGIALHEVLQFAMAVASYDEAIKLNPHFALAHNGRGNALAQLGQLAAALASCDRAIEIQPALAEGHLNRANVLKELGRFQESLTSYERAIAIKQDLVPAYYGRGEAHRRLGNNAAAVRDFDRAYALDPNFQFLQGLRLHMKMSLCDWQGFADELAALQTRITLGEAACPPFPVLGLFGSAGVQRRAAEIWVRELCPPNPSLPVIMKRPRHPRIRIGYFSADFRNHPLAYLTAELFERHDRARFETVAFSHCPNTQDPMRKRLEAAFEHFVDVRGRTDLDVARLARDLELDIAVDLGGFTQDARAGIFALRAAPVQVSYLGYLGTMGAPYMDYLIADAVTVPNHSRHHYAEKIMTLPSYQPNDSLRVMADTTYNRENLGLPSTGFVYSCFNTNYKITPPIFAAWMRVLTRVPGSVLWVYAESPTVEHNLRSEAVRRGIDAARIVFADRLAIPDYLARYRAADLFLDTFPYNAGATASDALWAGLPVLTCAGEAFASRVAASLLTAVGLPELVTWTLAEYEELAVSLANDSDRMNTLKRKLADARHSAPLFDAETYSRRLEDGFSMIYERHQAGEPPEHVFVPS
jgi:predicted O-linked N-acetylglucosamine transferase (SPINDLY family)